MPDADLKRSTVWARAASPSPHTIAMDRCKKTGFADRLLAFAVGVAVEAAGSGAVALGLLRRE